MSAPSDLDGIVAALGGRESIRHWFRAAGSGELQAWAAVVSPPEGATMDRVMILAGAPAHDWVVLLSAAPDDELFAAAMAQAIIRSPLAEIETGDVAVVPELWSPSTPNNHLPFRYRLSPALLAIRARYSASLLATGYGPPAYLAGTVFGVESSLLRMHKLVELGAAIVDWDRRRALEGLAALRRFAEPAAILELFPARVRQLAGELLEHVPDPGAGE